MHRSLLLLPTYAAASLLAACGGTRPAPGAVPPEAGGPAAADTTAVPAPVRDTVRRGYTAADVRFMQGMIAHHAQALAMTAMVATHDAREELRLVAERIEVSQRDEIGMMQRWLRRRGETAPDPEHAHHAAGAAGTHAMPGMLTPAELARLDSARGPAFDRLFLESMIRHHEGALVMVKELLAAPGAAQETELFRFASDVDADQRAEIRRMRALLATMRP